MIGKLKGMDSGRLYPVEVTRFQFEGIYSDVVKLTVRVDKMCSENSLTSILYGRFVGRAET